MYLHQNNNPKGRNIEDCVIRAVSTALGKSWEDTFWELSVIACLEADLLNANHVWGKYLINNGFTKHNLPDTCPLCYTIRDFANDHRHGIYVVGDGRHAVAVVDGYYIDSWDSGDRTVLFYFKKEE